MSELKNKIDFALIVEVKNANPNGDPLNGNRPRVSYDDLGEMSDVCLKRKIRNRLQQMGKDIFVQSADDKVDGFNSLKTRFDSLQLKGKDEEEVKKAVCEKWIDVRSFGQVFAFGNSDETKGDSIAIRGPVSIQSAFSCGPVSVSSIQITKSVNSQEVKGKGKSSDTMGSKHRVDYGIYVTYGSINPHFAQKTGFSEEDASDVRGALETLFENDCSSARPEGSMRVVKLVWCEHSNLTGNEPSAKVFDNIRVNVKDGVDFVKSLDDVDIVISELPNIHYGIFDGTK